MVWGPPVDGLQVLGVHQQARELIAVQLQAEEHPQAHVVNAALHSPVHSLGMIPIIMLGACGMKLFIAFPMIRLLEQDVRTDACLFKLPVIFHRGGGDIHINPADCPVLCLIL